MTQNIIRCFLIDDDPEEHEIFGYALKQLDLAVECQYFKSPKIAMDAFESSGKAFPAYVFLDMNMNGVPVLNELSELQHMFPFPATRIALYSSVFPMEALKNLTGEENLTYCFKQPTVEALSIMLAAHFNQNN